MPFVVVLEVATVDYLYATVVRIEFAASAEEAVRQARERYSWNKDSKYEVQVVVRSLTSINESEEIYYENR